MSDDSGPRPRPNSATGGMASGSSAPPGQSRRPTSAGGNPINTNTVPLAPLPGGGGGGKPGSAKSDQNAYKQHAYGGERFVTDSISFMPLIIGAFEKASHSSNDCHITMPLSRFRLPEVDFAKATWNRKTWRDTNRVRNALSKLNINPFDAMFTIDAEGKSEMTPFLETLKAMAEIETEMVNCLKRNRSNIADCASGLRSCVANAIKLRARCDTTGKAAIEVKQRLISMLKSAFRDRQSHYERLPFLSKKHRNNEVFNGVDYYDTFFKVLMSSSEESLKKFTEIAKTQETNSINIAKGNMERMAKLYSCLSNIDTDGSGFLSAVMKAFQGTSLEDAGLPNTPTLITMSTGVIHMEFQRLIGFFLWELLLERTEVLRSNVFSFFSIVTHYNGHDDGKCAPHAAGDSGTHAYMTSAPEMTDRFMESAVPACFGCLFDRLCPPVDLATISTSHNDRSNFDEIRGFFRSLKQDFQPAMKSFFEAVHVMPFSEAVPTSSKPLTDLMAAIDTSIFDQTFPAVKMRESVDLKILSIPKTLKLINDAWSNHLSYLRKHVLGRNITAGDADEHPLTYYTNKARDIIYRILQTRLGHSPENPEAFKRACQIVYATYCTDGAFSGLYALETEKFAFGYMPWYVRQYYKHISNPISIKADIGWAYDLARTNTKLENDLLFTKPANPNLSNVHIEEWVFKADTELDVSKCEHRGKFTLDNKYLKPHPFRPRSAAPKKKKPEEHTAPKADPKAAAPSQGKAGGGATNAQTKDKKDKKGKKKK